MRKHFLLLMLMALLPLVSWAAPISETAIIAESPYYGYLPEITGGLTEGVDFEVVAYYTDATMATEVSATNVKKTAAGTDLVALVRGLGSYEGTVKLSFQIKANPLTITGTQKSKAYGSAEPTGNNFFEVSTITDAKGNDVKDALADKITFGRVSGSDKGFYPYTGSFTGANASLANNYTIASANIKTTAVGNPQAKFEITAKTFNDTNIAIADIAGTFTYSGDEFKPTVTVTDITLNTNPTLLELNKDYTVAYTDNTNAGAATITVTGKGNYSGASLTKNFTINKAPLVVTPVLSKDYNGTTALPETTVASFTFQGWKKNDSKELVTAFPSNAQLTVTDAAIYAGTYKLTIDNVADFTITGNNYNILKQDGTFTIKKINLTIGVTNETKAYGVDPAKAINKTGTTIGTDWDQIPDVVEVTVSETPEASGANKGKYKMTPAAKANPYNATTQTANYNAFEAKLKTLNSYNVTWNPGYLTITKATLYVGLDETKYTTLSKTYDGAQVSVAAPTTAQLLVTGLLGDDTAAGVLQGTPGIEVENNSAKAGTYNIQVTGLTATNYDIVPITSQYKINPKPLKVTIYDQAFKTGALVSSLNQTLYAIDKEKGLAATDAADEVFKLAFDGVTTSGDPLKIDNDANVANGIIAVASDADPTKTKWGNYAVEQVKGTVIIVAATAITLDDTKNLTTVLTTDKDGATVTFNARALNAEQWNVLVLPFEVSVKDLSAAFDYAAVDVLDVTKSDGDVHFRLKAAGTIAANTPFLIYPSGVKNNLNQVVFNGVNVKKQTKQTVEVKDGANNKFVGTYATTGIYGETFRYLSKGMWYDASNYTESSKCNIKPLRGYLDLSANANAARVVIYIDEPDGTVTAIKAINAEVVSEKANAEGWYTLQGVKLDSAPTQKGIYIYNGKKVAIK